MEKLRQKSETSASSTRMRAGRGALVLRQAGPLILAALLFCRVGYAQAEDPKSTGTLRNQNDQQAPPDQAAVSDAVADDSNVSTLKKELARPDVPRPPVEHPNYWPAFLASLLAGGLAFRRLVPKIAEIANRQLTRSVGGPAAAAAALADDKSISEFATSLRSKGDGSAGRGEAKDEPQNAGTVDVALREFCASAVKDVAMARKFVAEIGRASDEGGRQKLLVDLSRQIGSLKRKSDLPGVLPFRQIIFAFEGLLKQLTQKASNVTPSALRTLTGAVDLLEASCIPGLKQDLASDPPVRLLVVDDDAVSRHAIAVTLKKALTKPDIATNGEAALNLAAEHPFDVIFLDVQMPGMDGFEVCSKIHEFAVNRTTPVVFVTCQGDFGARAKSTRAGGHELIAKPFLSFEIVLKALTLVLASRVPCTARKEVPALPLQSEPVVPFKPRASASSIPRFGLPPSAQPVETRGGKPADTLSAEKASLLSVTEKSLSVTPVPVHSSLGSTSAPLPLKVPSESVPEISQRGETPSTLSSESEPDDHVNAFFRHAPARLESLRDHLQALSETTDEEARQDMLGDIYLGIHALTSEAGRAEQHSALRLSTALQGLLKKFLDQPEQATSSTLETAIAAVDLLDELCRTRLDPDLANPPLRVLVVDDDPVARRAISGGLQLAFGKPECAESGEAALALAAEKAFDTIFLDVRMPGMDGFATCSKIHETAGNCKTPIVFITSHNDQESRVQAALAGGSGFIPKPVLASEIRVAALTSCLRGRLEQLKTTPALEAAAG